MKPPTPLIRDAAITLGLQLAERLAESEEICFAGAIRREEIRALEISLVIALRPHQAQPFRQRLDQLRDVVLHPATARPAWGAKYRAAFVAWAPSPFRIHEGPRDTIPADARPLLIHFHLTDRATFGVKLAAQTGPAEFCKAFYTPRRRGGLLDDKCFAKQGAIYWHDDADAEQIYLPQERDFFELLSCGWIHPSARANFCARSRRR